MKEYLTYDDVQIVPKYSSIEHRSDCDVSTKLTKNIKLDIPIVSSSIDTIGVTGDYVEKVRAYLSEGANIILIDTVHGHCEECEEDSIMVAIVTDYYRCTNCGADTRQHVNGSIRYLRLNESDKKWLKENRG